MRRRRVAPSTGKPRKTGRAPTAKRRRTTGKTSRARTLAAIDVAELESVRHELERVARASAPPRWNANPDDVQRSVVKLVLTLIEFIRQLLERQAIRRMEAGTLTADETEAIGLALMRLEETVRDLGARFDLTAEDLNLDLGPAGKLI
ncbi:MAG TPA: gas vesicle protein K [Vicinamibacterales bacterium]|nr:gas vesicle protein K [Vicinamibacterales bacterium]